MPKSITSLLLGLCGALSLGGAPAEKPPTVREVMKKLNRGPSSVTATIGLDLKDDEPDWEAIREQTAEYVKLTAGLAKQKPAKGDAASWERFAGAYAGDSQALDAAAKRKNRRAASAALARINNSCSACHKAHKPE